jgi:dTDP-4-dehydrorhamnose reductase
VRALITGGGGQLASDLVALVGGDARAFTREELDICDEQAVERAYREVEPDVVVNCAAFHNLDACEREPARAWSVNVEAVRSLARRGVRLVHISTNYVFDGRREEPYGEEDLPAPRSVYALSKLAGEHAALAYGERSLIVRTAGLYGRHGSGSKGGNFVQRMLARAREDGTLRVVADQRLQPTFTADLAAAILQAIRTGAEGVVHLTASGSCSWYEFTRAIMAQAGVEVSIEPTATVVGPDGIDRPLNGVLARPRADTIGLPALRPWEEALSDYLQSAGLTAGAV